MVAFNYRVRKVGRTSLYVITAAGFASAAAVAFSSADFPFFHGVARSSRALFTITSNVIDYKYSLRGLSDKSDDYRRLLSEVHLRSARRMLRLCEVNKGFYVKAGQFVSAVRQVPKEYSSTLSSLQDQAVPCEFEAIKEVLVSSLGLDLSEIFYSFDEQPVAAASIAQVHHAILKNYQEVAVKVQYPGLESKMKFDLTTMSFLSKFVAWLFPEYRFEWVVSEFAKSIASELDFIQEAKNSAKAAMNFKSNSIIKFPRVFWDFTTNKVLTMQFCRGQKIDDLDFLKQNGISPVKVAKALCDVIAEMIFVHGFLHGDLHPGNILISPEGHNGFSIVLLDHGIYKELDEAFRLKYCKLWKALIFMDSYKIQQLGNELGVGKYARYFPVIFTGRTINSKSTLGRGMSEEEKRKLKQELRSFRMEDISSFMESLSSDFLSVLRTDGQLRSLISKLGAPQRVRLLTYAKYSLLGLSLKENTESGFIIKVVSRYKTSIGYIQLRLVLGILELVSWMEEVKSTSMKRMKQVLNSWLSSWTFLSSLLFKSP